MCEAYMGTEGQTGGQSYGWWNRHKEINTHTHTHAHTHTHTHIVCSQKRLRAFLAIVRKASLQLLERGEDLLGVEAL